MDATHVARLFQSDHTTMGLNRRSQQPSARHYMRSEKWELRGDIFEACSCQLLCPCHISWRQTPNNKTCDATWGTHIEKGHYGKTDLGGLNTLVGGRLPGPTMYHGNATAILYIDDKANTSQEEALISIFSASAGGTREKLGRFLAHGKYHTIRRATLKFEKQRRLRSLIAPSRARLRVE